MDSLSPPWPANPDPSPASSRPLYAERDRYRRGAFYLGLASGVLIITCAFLAALLMTFLGLFGAWPETWWWGIDDPDSVGELLFAAFLLGLWGLVTGALVLWGAARLRANSDNALAPGLAMTAGGLLSFLALGGFVVGGIGAIIAGVLAVAGAPPMALERGPRLRSERLGGL